MLSIDHSVLTVWDIQKTVVFYKKVLNVALEEFDPPRAKDDRHYLVFGTQKINFHPVS